MDTGKRQTRLVSLFRREFELCKVQTGELAAILICGRN